MLKLGHNSREHIIDFIEKSGKVLLLRQYYLQLLIHSSFKNQLIKIGKIINRTGITCSVAYQQISAEGKSTFDQLKEDLKLANIALKNADKISQADKSDFYLLTNESKSDQNQIKATILILTNNNFIQDASNEYLDFSDKEQYYFWVFKLLRKVINHNALEEIIQEFNNEYQAIENSLEGQNKEVDNLVTPPVRSKLIKNKNFILALALFSLLTSWIIILKFFTLDTTTNQEHVSNDLPLPYESMLLKRPSILDKIEEKLDDSDSIQTIALVGIAGAGKTTIAHQYARAHNISLIWEINAETKDSLISSFKQLAYYLCKTEEDKRQLVVILQTKDEPETKIKLLMFLTKRIRHYPHWLIIYNNVKTFKDIQEYFPYDLNVWGNGKVIITTNDSNIAYNNYIVADNAIHVDELSKEEKLELFNKIFYNGKNCPNDQQSIIEDFLEKIPSFPLDVSIAAYYIKEARISCSNYLKYMAEPEFVTAQRTILNDVGNYNKTRYDIVTLSIKHIIETHPDFADLLLLISLIDAQDIPKDLLIAYKNEIIVSKLMHELRKFSLITGILPNTLVNNDYVTFSVHRSTQTITLTYLTEVLKLEQNSKQLQDISVVLERCIASELNIPGTQKISLLASHVEMFLSHNKLLNKIITASLDVQLAIYYFHIANYQKAQTLLEQALTVYKEYYGVNHLKTAEILVRLSSIYRNMGEYIKTKELLEHALTIYQQEYGAEHIRTAWASAYLGNVYHNIGEYVKARELLEHALIIYQRHYGDDHTKTAWISVRLANLYSNIGEYTKAKALVVQALKIYKKHNGENSIETAWSLSHLGNILTALGDYTTAKETINQSLIIYNNLFPKDHIITAWTLTHLGNVQQYLGNYKESQKHLEQALIIYEKIMVKIIYKALGY